MLLFYSKRGFVALFLFLRNLIRGLVLFAPIIVISLLFLIGWGIIFPMCYIFCRVASAFFFLLGWLVWCFFKGLLTCYCSNLQADWKNYKTDPICSAFWSDDDTISLSSWCHGFYFGFKELGPLHMIMFVVCTTDIPSWLNYFVVSKEVVVSQNGEVVVSQNGGQITSIV